VDIYLLEAEIVNYNLGSG